MIKTIEQAIALANKYNKINSDKKRLQFLKDNNKDLIVILDNDATMVSFIFTETIDEDLKDLIIEKVDLNSFDEYHGWGAGNIELFQFAGITAEAC